MSILRSLLILLLTLLTCAAGSTGAQPKAPGEQAASPSLSPSPLPVGVITVVLDDDYPPYSFRDARGQLQGILVDTWALWQAHTGLQVKLQGMPWAQALQTMQAGQADVIDAIFETEARRQLYAFSKPYANIDVPIFFHRDIGGLINADALRGFTVGVKKGDACVDILLQHQVGSLKNYASYSAVIEAAAAGDVRVFCMDEPPAVYLLNQRNIANDFRHSEALSQGAFHRAVRLDHAALLDVVEGGFAAITASQRQAIEDKWYGSAIHWSNKAPYARQLGYAVLALVLFGFLIGFWNLQLRWQVRAKTASLAASVEALQQAKQAAENALTELNAIAAQVPGMVYQYLLRPDGTSCLPYASEAVREVHGVRACEVVLDATPLFALIHPDDLSAVKASIDQSAQQLVPWQCEYRVKLDDGRERWLFGNALPQRLPDGSTLWHGFINDITERRATDEKLLQLASAFEQAPVAIAVTDLDGRIDYVNPCFTQITGYTLREVQGQNPRILQSGRTPSATFVDMWAKLKAGQVWQGELINRKKNGDEFTEDAVIAPVLDAHGVATHYVAIKQDITQRKQAELALQATLQEKVALLNEVHHRVKNNLQVITSLLRLEAARATEPHTQAVLKDMQERIRSMALLHETLYRSGNFAGVNLADYLKQLATQVWRAQSSARGDVRLVFDMVDIQLSLDQAAPCGLLVNELLSNALKHAFADGRAGEVRVRLQPAALPGQWCLSVSDTGCGLPPDFDARRSQSLGLQLVSDLARQLGGTLAIGTAPGSKFSVTFTVATPAFPSL